MASLNPRHLSNGLTWFLVEDVFTYKGVLGDRRVLLVATKLCGYAYIWWAIYFQQQFFRGLEPIDVWRDIKDAMMVKFTTLNFQYDMLYTLQNFKQDAKTVDEYSRGFHKLSFRSCIGLLVILMDFTLTFGMTY